MSIDELFRKEVSQVAGGRSFGKVHLSQPRIYVIASAVSTVMLLSLVACAALIPIKRRALAYGLVVSEQGTTNILAPIPGVIDEVYVREGDKVGAGAPLLKVTNEVEAAGVTSTSQSIIQSLETRQQTFEVERTQATRHTEQTANLLREKLAGYDAEIAKTRLLAGLEQEKSALVQRREADISNLAASNFVSKSQVVDRQLEVLDQKARVEDIERQLQDLSRARLSTSQELAGVQADGVTAAESLTRSIAGVAEELTMARERGERVLRSPRAGSVIGVLAAPGNTVKLGQLLEMVVPDEGKLAAELYVPAKSISRISRGMPVEIRYEAFPYQKYGQFLGNISSITAVPIQPSEFSGVPGIRAAIVGTEPVYRVAISIPGQSVGGRLLEPGMALSAAIISEEKTVLRWLSDDFFHGSRP